jgi:hypothetical protein
VTRRFAAPVAGLAVLLLVGGCGGTSRPSASSVLGHRLDRVDHAIVAEHWAAARTELTSLREDAASAQTSGELSTSQANAVQAAAARLLARLPNPGPTRP